jgi:hypothetical protein
LNRAVFNRVSSVGGGSTNVVQAFRLDPAGSPPSWA